MRTRAGTTLVEVMVCIAIVGIFAGATMGVATQSTATATYAAEKEAILKAVQTELDVSRQRAHYGSVNTGTTNTTRTDIVPYSVTISRTMSSIALTNRMYNLRVTATWDTGVNPRRGSMVLETKVFREP